MSNDNKLGVYRYSEEFGRMGALEGVFVASRGTVAAAMGREAYLGEVLGKHSEVTATIDDSTVTLITEEKVAVDLVTKHNLSSGINPLDYIEDDEEDDE